MELPVNVIERAGRLEVLREHAGDSGLERAKRRLILRVIDDQAGMKCRHDPFGSTQLRLSCVCATVWSQSLN